MSKPVPADSTLNQMIQTFADWTLTRSKLAEQRANLQTLLREFALGYGGKIASADGAIELTLMDGRTVLMDADDRILGEFWTVPEGVREAVAAAGLRLEPGLPYLKVTDKRQPSG